MDRYAVVGQPVAHSLSPAIHAAFAEATGEGLVYDRLPAPRDGFVATIEAFFAEGGRGLNVTLPFKEEAFAHCAGRVTERARVAGAVNTLHRVDGVVHGDNTDGAGLVADLARLGAIHAYRLAGMELLLLGAGGASRGVIAPLFDAGIHTITIVNRTPERALALAAAFPGRRIAVATFDQLDGQVFDVIVNATSAGVAGESVPVPAGTLCHTRLAYDMMYGAVPTPFLRAAAEAGAPVTSDGLGMLVEQAAEAFFLWRGVRPETAPVLAALRERLAREPKPA